MEPVDLAGEFAAPSAKENERGLTPVEWVFPEDVGGTK